MADGGPLLEARNLRVTFSGPRGVVRAVRGVSFDVGREKVGIVGESGSGKSMTGYSIMGLVDEPGRIVAGSIRLEGAELTKLDREACRG